MNIKSEVVFTFNICFQVGHLKVVVDPVDHEIGEPGVLSSNLEKLVEELEALLAEVVSEDFEAHESLVLGEGLGEEGETHVIDLIITHIQVDQTFVDCDGLSYSFGTIITALVISQVERFKRAVITF